MERLCNYVDPKTQAHCKAKAEYEITTAEVHGANNEPTDTCTAHIGELLTDAFEHFIFRIT